jgi:hypothetical protein
MMMGPNAPSETPVIIEIRDPIAGYQYTLDAENHIAHRIKASEPPRVPSNRAIQATGAIGAIVPPPSSPPPSASVTPGPAQTTDPSGRTRTIEDLGSQSMEGVLARGHRITTVIPAGAEGNDAPITTVMETWFSQQIGMVVLSKNSDPRNGENVMRVTNIVIGDPDPGLFQPPPDYQVVDETGPFQIHFAAPARQ